MYPDSLMQNWTFRLSEGTRLSTTLQYMFRLSEDTGLSMYKIHHHVLQFVIGERLNACFTFSLFSADVLGRPLLTASNTDPASINFLCIRRIEERDGGLFLYLS